MEGYRYCPNCGTEYRAGFERCADCDVELTDEAPAPEPETRVADTTVRRSPGAIDPESDLVEVYRSSSTDAEGVRSFLEGHGIPAVAIGEGMIAGYTFNVGPLGERRVMVRLEHAADAQGLIDQVWGPRGGEAEAEAEAPSAIDRGGLGFPTALLVVVAIVITVGIVLAYMPGTP